MPASAAQYQFAAEFALFLVSLGGLTLVVFRPDLLTDKWWARLSLAVGFLALGAAAVLHGSLLVVGPDEASVVGPRAGGIVALAIGGVGCRASRASRQLLWAGVAVTAAALAVTLGNTGSLSAGIRAAGALVLGSALLVASRRSIAASVAASAAATLLLVVLVLSVALSAIVADTVEDEAIRRLDNRTGIETAAVESRPRDTSLLASRLTASSLDNPAGGRVGELLAVAGEPRTSASVATDLASLSKVFLDPSVGLLYLGPTGFSVADNGQVAPEVAVALAGSRAVRQVLDEGGRAGITSRPEAASVEVLGRRALAVAASATQARQPDQSLRLLGAAVATFPLSENYLSVRTADDDSVSLTLATRTEFVGRAGPQPPEAAIRRVATEVLDEGRPASTITDGRFIAARPVRAGDDRLVLALVASQPTTVVDELRRSLFRTLFLIALGGAFLAFLLATIVGDRISAGLRRLTATAASIRSGRLDVRADIKSEDEVGVLGGAFDSMVSSLEEQTAALHQAAADEARLRNRLEAVVAGMGEALIAVDADGLITDFNEAAEVLLGVPGAGARGRRASEVVRGRADDGSDLSTKLAGHKAGTWSSLATVVTAEDEEVAVAATAGALRGPEGELAGGVLVLRDLRREREVERMKREFLSRVGHELRTPLTPIIGYAQLLATRKVPPERAAQLHGSIYESSKRLARIVQMLEFFASLEAGQQVLRPEPVSPREVVSAVVAGRSDALPDGMKLISRVERGVPQVLADREWLVRSIDELIDNAVKFSPGGGSVRVAASSSNGEVEISVTDRGIGMTPEAAAEIFTEWAQGDESDTRRFGGLGLGLALAQRVAENHGGRVTCDTAPGKGSKFSIVLPALPINKGNEARTRTRRAQRGTGSRGSLRP